MNDSKTAPVSVRENFTDTHPALAPTGQAMPSPGPHGAYPRPLRWLRTRDYHRYLIAFMRGLTLFALGYAVRLIFLLPPALWVPQAPLVLMQCGFTFLVWSFAHRETATDFCMLPTIGSVLVMMVI